MDADQIEEARREIVEAVVGLVNDKVEAASGGNNEHRTLAMAVIGTLLGTAYCTEHDHAGAESAKDFMVMTLTMAEISSRMCGSQIPFKFVLVEKEEDRV